VVEVLAANAEIPAGAPIEAGAVRRVLVPAAAATGLLRPADEASLQTLRPRIALQVGDRLRPELFAPATTPPSATVPKKGRRFTLPMTGAESLRAGDHIDLLLYATDLATQEGMTMTVLQNIEVLDAGQPTGAVRPVSVALLPEEGEVSLLATRVGSLQASLRNPSDPDIQEERGRATMQTLLTGERINTLLKKRMELEKPRPIRPTAPLPAPPEPAAPAPEPTAAATKPTPKPEPESDWGKPAPTGPLAPTIEILDR
jgi:pilus assembly protein CpaB